MRPHLHTWLVTACLAAFAWAPGVFAQNASSPRDDAAAKGAAAADAASTHRFAATPQDMDPSAANKTNAAALAQDPAFSAAVAKGQAERFDDLARQTLQPGIDRQQRSLDSLMKQQASVMPLKSLQAAHHDGPPPVYRIYVSRALDAGTMKAIVELSRDRQDTVVVFRGLLPGEKINHLATYLGQLVHLQHTGPLPKVMLDPVPFRKNHVMLVPTLEKLAKDGSVVASVRGLISTTWIDDQVARGQRGDLGKMGPVVPVAEEDIVTVLQRKLAAMDLKGSAQKSLQAYWSRQAVWPLTRATRDRTREVDPSVTITDAITAPDGTVLAYPGQKLNPMDVMPFNLALIVIDARDPVQMKFAASMVKHLGLTPVRVLTIGETDWQAYQDHVVALGVPLYTLRQEIIDRFGLQHVPSVVVSGKNKMLEVREYALPPPTYGHEVANAADHSTHR